MLLASAILLVVGIVGEWPESETWKNRIWYRFAKAAVLFGVIGELLADGGIFLASARLQALQEVAVQAAQRDTENARLELARFKAPRSLSPGQQTRIAEKVRQFAGSVFDVSSLFDTEPEDLLEQIETIFLNAGWKETDWTGRMFITRPGKPSIGLSLEKGITLIVERGNKIGLLPAAKALAAALTIEGISAEAKFAAQGMPINPNVINIAVGRKLP